MTSRTPDASHDEPSPRGSHAGSDAVTSCTDTRPQALAAFAGRIPGLLSANVDEEIHAHMGATISEAVLQAGISYETVVKPRVERLRARHPEAVTTTAFLELMRRIEPSILLGFRGRKPHLVRLTAELLREARVETEADLRLWIELDGSQERLKRLSGIGDKTVDYFKMLCGIRTCAIDVHVLRFIEAAGVEVTGYADAKAVVSRAAELLRVDPATFDRGIWDYMKRRG
ncbi:hypothetical protein BE04_43870 [Sorangium cellulosum]|uniref:HhH-GPD domain-containing protein n=2 Tax=Sorangium cellulosum TaxID=56 RepID=A0A150PHG3_SORCE|nr:hypothetical protein [Sorangium cellulosum]AGP36722.1 hypothetical protein SCE1572_20835 [Sorangium cellulosum So0157-2]KYF55119.1 hypothetical protein BE04_43870 [Sorangium cellulosum]